MPRQSRLSVVSHLHAQAPLLRATSMLALFGALGTALPAEAASTTIVNGQTVSQQTLTNGDTLTVDAGGTVDDSSDAARAVNAGTVTVHNSGTIHSLNSIGINASQSTLDLDNSGTGAIAGAQEGVYAGTITSLANSGLITGVDEGVLATTIFSLTNSGTIGSSIYGISATTIGTLVNSNLITGGDTGIITQGLITDLTNDGTISGFKGGINAGGGIASLTNTNLISGGQIGVYSGASIGSLTNSGIIAGLADHAISADGDIGSLTNSGTIAGFWDGIYAGGNIDALVNDAGGTISGGQLTDGIFLSGTLASLTNNGVITGGGTGLHANGDITALTNGGTISGGATAAALISGGTIAALTNSGTISGGGAGVSANDIGALTNSGTILATGAFGVGIGAAGDIDAVTNSGTISGDLYGIATLNGTLTNLNNTGTIQSDHAAVWAHGIAALTNSGLIAASIPAQDAILEDPTSNTDTILTLNAGSVLIGHVLISGGNDTLNVGNGLNLALTFDNSVPELIKTNGASSVVIGNTVYVADMATITGQAGLAADLSGGIAGAVSGALDHGFDEKGTDGRGRFWLQGIGGMGHEAEGNSGSAANDWFAGTVLGGDFGADADARAGFFLGAARGAIDATASSNTADSFLGGVYGSRQFEDFSVKGQVSAGFTHGNLSRTIANNTVATGLETATATDDAYFVSPGITFTKPWVTPNMAFETSLAINYTGVFSSGFTETGAAGAVSVGANSQHIFDVQALLRLPFEQTTESGMLTGDFHTGLVGRAQFSTAGLSGTLAGTDVTFAAPGTSLTAGIVAGGALSLDMGGGAKIFAGLDGTLRSGFSASVTANAGIQGAF